MIRIYIGVLRLPPLPTLSALDSHGNHNHHIFLPKMLSKTVSIPSFSRTVIEDKRTDGYWIEAFHFSKDDKAPGLIA